MAIKKQKTGVLLINLGSPDAPTRSAVQAYLKEFFSDPHIISLPKPFRFLVAHCLSRWRAQSSAHYYQKIWTSKGSPLLIHTEALTNALKKKAACDYAIAFGMRYGQPSITDSLVKLHAQGCTHFLVFPLFPQYTKATNESAILKATAWLIQHNLPYRVVPDFFTERAYLDNLASLIQTRLHAKPDYLLFSYHGLPHTSLPSHYCKQQRCDGKKSCPLVPVLNRCYRNQCFTTAKEVARRLNLKEGRWGVAFQSRLGFLPWIKPYTTVLLKTLSKQGIKHLLVTCPSFVADCLETLEEIDLRLKAQWLAFPNTTWERVPALNALPQWTEDLHQLIATHIKKLAVNDTLSSWKSPHPNLEYQASN